MNNLTGLIPVLYAALQVVSRELVGFIPATSRNMQADGAALNQIIRVPVTPETENQDITPGTPPTNGGTDFSYVDMAITKNRIAKPIKWNGDEQISVGNQLNPMVLNQFTQAMRALVNEMERDVCLEGAIGAISAGNVLGVAGTVPFATNLSDLAKVKKFQDDLGTPLSQRHFVINTSTGMNLRSLEKLTNVNQAGENDMLRRGVIHDLLGYSIRESGGFRPVDGGTATGFTLNGAASAGARTVTVNAISGTINPGAVILLGGKYYTVASPVLSGATSINIEPALAANLSSGAAATIAGAYTPNVAFSQDFIYLATRIPAMPKEGDGAKDVYVVTDPVSGLSFQTALYGDYRQIRIEIGAAWGVKAINKRHGVLLMS